KYRAQIPNVTRDPESRRDLQLNGPIAGQTIQTPHQASDLLKHAERVIMFGDAHIMSTGHNALVALMPTLKQAHVKALAMELPADMKDDIAQLQSDIRSQKLAGNDVMGRLDYMFQQRGLTANGGPSATLDMGNIIVAATNNNIRVVPVDNR